MGREDVDDAVHGLRRAGGVQGAEDQVAGLGGGYSQLDCLQVAHLADQYDVRIFAQGGPQSAAEGLGVDANLALVDQDFLCGWTNSIGSSMVRMWAWRSVLIRSIIAARVVDLPEPVGPVTRTRPRSSRASCVRMGGRPSSWAVLIWVGMTRKTAPSPRRRRRSWRGSGPGWGFQY